MVFTLKKKILYSACSVLIIAGVFVLGIYLGYAHRPAVDKIVGVSNTTPIDGPAADFGPFWQVWKTIDEKYPEAKNVTAQQRVYGAIQGLVDSLGDPYSVYFPPADSKDFQDTIEGSFEGIGMEVGIKEKVLTVIAPLKDTPAERAGIRAGDLILKIDDTATTDMSVDKAVSLIRGTKGTPVRLTIYRQGEEKPREISIIRDVIDIPTLDQKLRPDGIYVITLYNFSASSARLMQNAVDDFKKSGATKLIIDLRNNPGGYLDAAVDIAGHFLPEGDTIVTEDFGDNGSPRVYRSKGYDMVDTKKVKIVVLADRGSASASEILAGALQQHKVAPLIGEQTYGKGSVQEVIDVTNDTTLKLTIAKWLTPDGTWISKKGLTPDIAVTVTDSDLDAGRDPIMDRAVEYFKNGK